MYWRKAADLVAICRKLFDDKRNFRNESTLQNENTEPEITKEEVEYGIIVTKKMTIWQKNVWSIGLFQHYLWLYDWLLPTFVIILKTTNQKLIKIIDQ